MKTILLLTCVALLAFIRVSNAQIIYPSDPQFQPSLPEGTIEVGPDQTGSDAWTFSNHYADAQGNLNETGIAANGAQNIQGEPNGQASFQVGYLQDVGSISQSITLPTAGDVSVSFEWEGRTPIQYTNAQGQTVTTGQNQLTVTLDGITLFTGTPTNTSNFDSITTSAADFLAGTYTLAFIGGPLSGVETQPRTDNMTFIDDIQLNELNTQAVPEPLTLRLTLLGGVILFVILRRLKTNEA